MTTNHDETIVRGDPGGISCSVFCFRNGTLAGVESVNRPADYMAVRKILAQGVALSPAQAADENVDLKRLAAEAAAEAHS